MEFVSLHHHSTYSFKDGYGTPDQHCDRAVELGYDAMALTEHGLSGTSAVTSGSRRPRRLPVSSQSSA